MAERSAPGGAAAFDPRVTPVRPGLGGQPPVVARPGDGRVYEVRDPTAPLRHAPSPDAPLDTEALKGEQVTIYDISEDGWAWGQLAGDGYVGFVPASALCASGPAATHKVTALRTFVFPGPSIKLPPLETLSFGCQLVVAHMDGPFAMTASGGYVSVLHLVPVETMEADFVAVAERFAGTPYLWGGKTSLGLDCSGLVQVALNACGISCPPNSAGAEMPIQPPATIRRAPFTECRFWTSTKPIP